MSDTKNMIAAGDEPVDPIDPVGKQISGSLTLEIGPPGQRTKIVLPGTVGKQIQVGFRSKDDDPEIPIGTFTTIIGSVATAIGAPASFEKQFNTKLTELGSINPAFKMIETQLRHAQLFVTDLYVQAEADDSGTYKFQSAAFGFRVEFSELELGPVKIVGFGVLFELGPDETTGAEVAKLSSRAG